MAARFVYVNVAGDTPQQQAPSRRTLHRQIDLRLMLLLSEPLLSFISPTHAYAYISFGPHLWLTGIRVTLKLEYAKVRGRAYAVSGPGVKTV